MLQPLVQAGGFLVPMLEVHMDYSAIARWEVRKAFILDAGSSHGCNADAWLVRDGTKHLSQMLLYESTVSIKRQKKKASRTWILLIICEHVSSV